MNILNPSLAFGLLFAAAAGAQIEPVAAVNTAGAGKVALGGHDPVAFFTDSRPVDGSPSITVEHQGAVYYFADDAHRQKFVAAPDRYLPQYGGYCAFGVSLGAYLPVDVDTWVVKNGKLYLNINPDVQKLFAKDFEAVVAKADTNWRELSKPAKAVSLPPLLNVAGRSNVAVGGYDAVAFFTDKKPVHGSPSIKAEHGGATWFFASEANRQQFEREPQRYLPQYGGYCAFGLSLGALLPADVSTWVVRDGKIYFNLNPEVAKAFAKDSAAILAKADAKWQAMQTPGK